jgi:hypothetical protein
MLIDHYNALSDDSNSKVQIPIGTDPRPTEGAGSALSVLQGAQAHLEYGEDCVNG